MTDSYWCHSCAKEIEPFYPMSENNEMMCPDCGGEFIEKIGSNEDNPADFIMLDDLGNPTSSTSQTSELNFFQPVNNAQNFNHFMELDPLQLAQHISAMQQIAQPVQHNQQNRTHQDPSLFIQQTNPNFFPPFNDIFENYSYLNRVFARERRNFEELLNQLFLTSGRNGNPPASQSAIDKLAEIEIVEGHIVDNCDCAICKDEFIIQEKVTKLPCQHIFHKDCIQTWLKLRNQCPMCRFEIETEDNKLKKETLNPNISNSNISDISNSPPSPNNSTTSSPTSSILYN